MKRRIIFDFDDTIAHATNRDWDNAEPNVSLIEQMERLYNSGKWVIDIYTARGSISCKTREEADQKYRAIIEGWLSRHNVKYHTLSFEKPLATYYVDDKALTPEEFVKRNFSELEGGLSGSDIYTDGEYVFKEDSRAHAVRDWYDCAKQYISVPEIKSVIGNTLCMNYIQHDENFFNECPGQSLDLVIKKLDAMKRIPVQTPYTYQSYVDRIIKHYDNARIPRLSHVIYDLQIFELKQSFAHGDFGIKNMLFSRWRPYPHMLYLIDPIPDMFGCTEIDSAKFIASLYLNEYALQKIDMAYDRLIKYNKISRHTFNALIRAEILRVYKYHPNKSFVEDLIRNVS